jgi:hypothetical protein
MAFFNANVDATLRNDLETAYEDMCYGGQYGALLGLFEKVDKDGDAVKVPLSASLGGGGGADAATAYANATLASRYAFIVTPFKCYGFTKVPLDQAAFTKGDNSVVDLLLDESKKAMDLAKMQFDQACASDGYGTVATITAHSGSTPNFTLTLSSTSDINHINSNSVYLTKDTPAGTLDSGSFTIANIIPGSKQIKVTAAGGWTPTDTHTIGQQGTYATGANYTTWPGIPAWIPPAANRPVSTSDSHFQVNRSADERKLAGSYLDGTSMGILEGVNQLAHQVADVPGSKVDLVVMSFQNKGKCVAKLQTEKRYQGGEVKGSGIDVFYPSIVIEGPHGRMDIVASSNWRSDLVAVLSSEGWKLGSPGNKPLVPASASGSPVIEIPGADACVVQFRFHGFLYTDAPGHNGMLTVKGS